MKRHQRAHHLKYGGQFLLIPSSASRRRSELKRRSSSSSLRRSSSSRRASSAEAVDVGADGPPALLMTAAPRVTGAAAAGAALEACGTSQPLAPGGSKAFVGVAPVRAPNRPPTSGLLTGAGDTNGAASVSLLSQGLSDAISTSASEPIAPYGIRRGGSGGDVTEAAGTTHPSTKRKRFDLCGLCATYLHASGRRGNGTWRRG